MTTENKLYHTQNTQLYTTLHTFTQLYTTQQVEAYRRDTESPSFILFYFILFYFIPFYFILLFHVMIYYIMLYNIVLFDNTV